MAERREKQTREAALARARALLDLGRPVAASKETARALALDPHDPAALQLHGLCLLRAGDLAGARAALRAAVAGDPEDAHGHYLLGYADREGGDANAAERGYREALRLSPEEPVYLRALAELLAGGKRFPEATALAEKAVELGPDRAANFVTLGFVASTSGDRVAARRAYEQALSIDPNDAVAWNNLGCVDLAQGKPMQARHRFREALRLNPEGALAKDNLKLVQPPGRPLEIYRGYSSFERQLVVELCEGIIFSAERASLVAALRASGGGLSDFREVHLLALLLATEGRAASVLWAHRARASRLLLWLGLSSMTLLRVLRLGPAGLAVAVTSGAATYLISRDAVSERRSFYEGHLARVRSAYEALHARWLSGHLPRRERDVAIDQLLDDLCKAVERGEAP